jgi:type II secretory pathway pseudopilin PulG
MTNDERNLARIRSSGLTSPSTLDIRLPRRSAAKPGTSTFGAGGAFTLIELLVVIAIIIVLTGLILSTVGYVQKKGARSRAETEIAAMSAACESYKADNGIYPNNSATNTLNAQSSFDPSATAYTSASLFLYEQLSGDSAGNRQSSGKSYFTFKPNMLSPADQTQNVQYIRDPFGNSYGYSTAGNPQVNPSPSPSPAGYNPTFDLWSTANYTPQASPSPTATPQNFWIKNW